MNYDFEKQERYLKYFDNETATIYMALFDFEFGAPWNEPKDENCKECGCMECECFIINEADREEEARESFRDAVNDR
jgi:hypothetical protein